ncbi:hypothetical protein E3N88_42565 [Mikania micrantha]|uniref:Uncharacterized protein n=1 Tax=Mikania micrantha TaxID=192012 RepID=A0A5N6LJM6_9ASTR|nr:hypothetical protein E3N88_42565 [Mikania micrantha]
MLLIETITERALKPNFISQTLNPNAAGCVVREAKTTDVALTLDRLESPTSTPTNGSSEVMPERRPIDVFPKIAVDVIGKKRSESDVEVTYDDDGVTKYYVSPHGAFRNIDAHTATTSSLSVGKTKVEEDVSPYKLRQKRTIQKPKKLK